MWVLFSFFSQKLEIFFLFKIFLPRQGFVELLSNQLQLPKLFHVDAVLHALRL